MSNKTFIPAFRCSVGDWKYYVCTMKYAEVKKQVGFAYEQGGNMELGRLIQRGISERTKDITDYLINSEHRFLGALVVAVWGGEPQYTPLTMVDPDGMLTGLDEGFGVLTFDGTQTYFALDGQHRLKAIKDAVNKNPDLGKEDICVIIVTHYNTPEGRLKTRRLFTNINRNAKQTGAAENVALDEDDSFAILTRRLIEEHPFLSEEGRVNVIKSYNENTGSLKLHGNSVNKGDKTAFTTFVVLYDLLQYLAYDMPGAIRNKAKRPKDEILDTAYETFSERLDDIIKYCGGVKGRIENAVTAVEVRAPKNAEATGHPMMRPVIQKSVCRVVASVIQQGQVDWDTVMERLSQLDWRLGCAPWESVFNDVKKTMITAKENVDLLDALLTTHIAPRSKKFVDDALRDFKALKNKSYPISRDELYKRIPAGDALRPMPPTLASNEIKELSDAPEIPVYISPDEEEEDESDEE